MERHLRGGFVVENGITVDALGSGFMVMQGEIRCVGQLYIDVDKRLWLVRDSAGVAWVETVSYSYNCAVRQRGNVYRYDSPHISHCPIHHVHEYHFFDGDSEGELVAVDASDWATLSEVIDRFKTWYYDNFPALHEQNLA